MQQPPIRKLGVFDLDTFFPPADRTTLALRLNGLLASPAFAAWGAGHAARHRRAAPRRPTASRAAAIVSIAHLSDEERQFVTALLLSKVVTWMRRQSGTTDLRALVYMDEVAGYVPPTANPPTKKPIMTLMKQARAFGVGVVLSTQNPVDLDYKAISNAGTWMVGRLQTERDKARLLDGMSAAAGTVDVGAVSDTISGLGKREFVLKRAGKDKPEVFTTRWAMSYLRGPLTRDQITADGRAGDGARRPPPLPPAAPAAADRPRRRRAAAAPPAAATPRRARRPGRRRDPAHARGRRRHPGPLARPGRAVGAAGRRRRRWQRGYQAAAVARVSLRFDDEKADLVHDEEWEAVLYPLAAHPDPAAAVAVDYDDRDLLGRRARHGHLRPPRRPDQARRRTGRRCSATWSTGWSATAPSTSSSTRP